MSGNVWEWSDTGDYSDDKQPIFGGSAFSNSSNLRCAGVIDQTWNNEQSYIGFRCCATQGP
jgi:formylglycine-generating enzyme required for sulfatase activity